MPKENQTHYLNKIEKWIIAFICSFLIIVFLTAKITMIGQVQIALWLGIAVVVRLLIE